jgi:hypothetical protein
MPHLGEQLAGAYLVQLGQDGPGMFMPLLPAAAALDAPTAALLAGLQEGDRLFFWFTEQDSRDTPRLLLRADVAALKKAAKKVAGSGQMLRGTLALHAGGFCHFTAQQDAPWFLEALHAWSVLDAGPSGRLQGARLSCRASDGSIIARYRNDALWKRVTSNGG